MRAAVLALLLFACSRGGEQELRARLGIPGDARQVVIFAQNSHLDIDWQKSFPDYYDAFVKDIFVEARQILTAQPRAFYSVAEMAYLQRHLEQHPEELSQLRSLAASGALRVVGGGRTSPDTLLPETELLLRDFLYGARFAEDVLGTRARAAWLPDSFGHAATAPDLLAALGYESVFLGRIDGAPTTFETLVLGRRDLRPGSSAAQLEQLGSADFFWRGPGGGRVLAHWQPSGIYCTGDDIDYDEPLQLPGGHLGPFRGDDPAYTSSRIDAYVAELSPWARTPYLFVPVGCDFQHPKARLAEYLDRWNARHPGSHAVAATFADYAQLVSAHADALPEIEADLTPYFTGFLGSRAGVKRAVRDAARPYFAAEPFAAALGLPVASLEELTLSNHHDFITGTSADDVVAGEQMPLLARANQAGSQALQKLAEAISRRIPARPGAVARVLALNPSSAPQSAVRELSVSGPVHASDAPVASGRVLLEVPPFSWKAIDLFPGAEPVLPRVALFLFGADGNPAQGEAVTRAVIFNGRVRAELSRSALTSLRIDGAEALSGPSLTVHQYADQGGLWRLGHEMKGCAFAEAAPLAQEGRIEVLESNELAVRVALRSGDLVRELRLGAESTGLELALQTAAPQGTTRTVSFALAAPGPLRTSLAGGSIQRGADKLYSPTYWPAVSWASVEGWAILLRQSTGVRRDDSGALELLAARDARSEVCDLLGPPPGGSDRETHRIEWRIERAFSPADAQRAAQAWNRPIEALAVPLGAAGGDLPAEMTLLQIDGPGVISALKPADRGEGIVLRAELSPGPVSVHLSPLLAGRRAVRIDAAERDLEAVGNGGISQLTLDRGPIESVRLR